MVPLWRKKIIFERLFLPSPSFIWSSVGRKGRRGWEGGNGTSRKSQFCTLGEKESRLSISQTKPKTAKCWISVSNQQKANLFHPSNIPLVIRLCFCTFYSMSPTKEKEKSLLK